MAEPSLLPAKRSSGCVRRATAKDNQRTRNAFYRKPKRVQINCACTTCRRNKSRVRIAMTSLCLQRVKLTSFSVTAHGMPPALRTSHDHHKRPNVAPTAQHVQNAKHYRKSASMTTKKARPGSRPYAARITYSR
jgi:hypothetical protein